MHRIESTSIPPREGGDRLTEHESNIARGHSLLACLPTTFHDCLSDDFETRGHKSLFVSVFRFPGKVRPGKHDGSSLSIIFWDRLIIGTEFFCKVDCTYDFI